MGWPGRCDRSGNGRRVSADPVGRRDIRDITGLWFRSTSAASHTGPAGILQPLWCCFSARDGKTCKRPGNPIAIKSPSCRRSSRISPSISAIRQSARSAEKPRGRRCPPRRRAISARNLMALIAYLTVVCRMPRRVVEAFLQEVLHLPLSLGSTQNVWQQVSAAVAEPYQELEAQLKHEPVLNSDETGWRCNGEKRYLWALVAQSFAFYTVAATRSSEVLIHLLGAVFAGILCSDRYSAYFKYQAKGRAQLCWAHLKRDILGIQDFAKTS